VGRDYEVTLDRDASSFSLAHNPDGTVTITQPELLKKRISQDPRFPERPKSSKSQRTMGLGNCAFFEEGRFLKNCGF
jgi:hypothetical protein